MDSSAPPSHNDFALERILRGFRINRVLKYLGPDTLVCDVGCGYEGTFLRAVRDKVKGCWGIDCKVGPYSEGNLTLINGHIEKELPCESGTFDFVTMLAVLEHLENPENVVAECGRILKDGGRLAMTVPSHAGKPVLEVLARMKMVDPQLVAEHRRYWNKAELARLLKSAGFENIEHSYFLAGFNNFVTGTKAKP